MNGLLQELVNELNSNKDLNSSIITKMVLESINNSKLLGVPQSDIFENSITLLESLSKEMTNENMKEVVAKFKKMAEKPTARLQNMAREAGISIKLKAIKESQIFGSDPIVKQTVAKLEEALTKYPEFKVLPAFVDSLSKYSYDKTIAEHVQAVTTYIDQNRVKLEIMNAVHEMRAASPVIYSEPCSILETAILENIQTADSLKMKLGNHMNMPSVSRLINLISMFEAKTSNKFNIGSGAGSTKVQSVIAPFCKVSEDSAIAFINGQFIQVHETEDPVQVSEQVVFEKLKQFHETCRAFHSLNFVQNESSLSTAGRKLNFGFQINEKGNLAVKINGSIVEDLSSINLSEILLLESLPVRQSLNTIFENIDFIANIEFAKNIVNEHVGISSLVLNLGESIYVFENAGGARSAKKMSGTGFYSYVLESFKYDVSELYSIKLDEQTETIKSLDSQKASIEQNLAKLQESIDKINQALGKDSTISAENAERLNELKMAIEKNINQLKNQYIIVDQAKKKA